MTAMLRPRTALSERRSIVIQMHSGQVGDFSATSYLQLEIDTDTRSGSRETVFNQLRLLV